VNYSVNMPEDQDFDQLDAEFRQAVAKSRDLERQLVELERKTERVTETPCKEILLGADLTVVRVPDPPSDPEQVREA
jgi:hypothetical protein